MSLPLILTLKIDTESFQLFDKLRRTYFPPERNFLELVLTDKRLVLLKTKKIGGPATVKAQYAVRPANASRSSERKDEKDGKEGKDSKDSKELTRITSSDLKGDRGFVFLTVRPSCKGTRS